MKTAQSETSIQLPTNYLRNLLDLVAGRGGDGLQMMQRSGLSPELIDTIDGQISWEQFSGALRESRNEINEPGLGLYLGSQLTITTHGLLGLAAMSSPTLGDAARLACQYVATRTPLVSLRLEKKGMQVSLTIDELYALGDIRATFLETLTVTLLAVIDFVAGGQARVSQVNFAFQTPEYSSLYEAFFPCPVRFNQEQNQIILPAADLNIPSRLADIQVQRQAAQQCEQQLKQWQERQKLSGQIRMMLGRAKGRFPGFEQVADELSLSPRTLRRRLAEEGTSYQELLEIWRQEMAHQYLRTTNLSVQQISYLLGYNDPANFGRAFRKRNEGISPLRFRQQGQEAPAISRSE
ncbi:MULTISPECIES: AraC family transcriptional regulator [Oceanospirillaceae]|jgi:AraC-like DNA-binding protein|uniref:AraC family transcriptional regulator n=1 Tax=Oceanospirillaceae TaxID=135620 RepID=UPI001190D718|nr:MULTISPECIES: AraC family transcriptional regulator [Thalassolituus]MCB2387283.1 AraC family transcriptional regulator [Thalassolituus alkanivorans]MCB2424406.1 AraC family transcriptional regulator [Thalassolituus alkanivorans]TVV39436.1 AraC family transcriptional regulator [Thalassolituus sp. C2-1]